MDQIDQEITKFKRYIHLPLITQGTFSGGVPVKSQLGSLERGPSIVIGTPNRVLDLVNSGNLNTEQVRFLVLDEADELVSTGSTGVIINLFQSIPQTHPSSTKRRLQVMLYSATLRADGIRRLADAITRFPTWVDLRGASYTPEVCISPLSLRHHLSTFTAAMLDCSSHDDLY